MDTTIAVQKGIENAIKMVQFVVKKYQLGHGNAFFERRSDKDTKSLYGFVIVFKIGGQEIIFPIVIDTFGRTFMVSKLPNVHKAHLTEKVLDENFVLEVKLRGII